MSRPDSKEADAIPQQWVNGSGTVASPYSPSGGGGPGLFSQPGPLQNTIVNPRFPHPLAPSGRHILLASNSATGSKAKSAPRAKSNADVQKEIADRAEALANRKAHAVVAVDKHKATCWDLPEKLLQQAGGATSNDLTEEGEFKAGRYVWGNPVELGEVQRGDILQFTGSSYTIKTEIKATFSDGGTYSWRQEEEHHRAPIHSAIVLGADSDSKWDIVEQHVMGSHSVVRNTLYLNDQEISSKTTTETFVEPDTGRRHPKARVTRTISVVKVTDPGQTIKAYRPKAK